MPRRGSQQDPEHLYEAEVSVLLTGVDEWFWTAYCCVDTHFGSEESVEHYHERGLDAFTGGEKACQLPIWNPREYYLLVLSIRVRQVTREWSNLIDAIEERLQFHVSIWLTLETPQGLSNVRKRASFMRQLANGRLYLMMQSSAGLRSIQERSSCFGYFITLWSGSLNLGKVSRLAGCSTLNAKSMTL